MNKHWILLASIVLFQTILSGCVFTLPWQTRLPEECLAQNMLISKEDIGALEEGEPLVPMPDEPANSAINDFTPSPASTSVIRHFDRNIQSAYESYVAFVFQEDELGHSWSKPVDLSFESVLTDDFDYRCGYVFGEKRCRYVARFENYLVYLGLSITPDNYSLEDFSAGMAAIDREVGECFAALEESTPEP